MSKAFDNIHKDYKCARWARDENYYGSRLIFKPEVGRLNNVMDARFYVSRSGNTTWCRVWLDVGEKRGYGVGKATGWGYDRESSAFVNALENMGVDVAALREETADPDSHLGIEGGVGMSYIMPRLKKILPDGERLVEYTTGS